MKTYLKFDVKTYLLKWFIHLIFGLIFGPLGAIVYVWGAICDWFKYRPKTRDFYVDADPSSLTDSIKSHEDR